MKIEGPNQGPKEAKIQSSRSGGPGGTEPTTVCLWRAPRTVVGGDARSCSLHARSCAPRLARPFDFCVWLLVFLAHFQAVLLNNADIPRPMETPNTLPFHLHFDSQSFRVVQREKEGAAKNYKDSEVGFAIERRKYGFG